MRSAIAVMLVVVVGCAPGRGPDPDAEPAIVRGAPAKECRVKDTVSFGDVSVTVMSMTIRGFTSRTNAGNVHEHAPHLLVALRIKNFNPNRNVTIHSQASLATAKDDVGNSYEALFTATDYGALTYAENMLGPGMVFDLRSDEVRRDTVVFKRPVPGASSLTVRLAAEAYGGKDWLAVKASRAEWEK